MTIIVIVPMSEGIIVAADGSATNSFTSPFWRYRKIRTAGDSRIVFVMGSGVEQTFTPSQGRLQTTFDPAALFAENLPAISLGESELRSAAVACCAEFQTRQPDPVNGSNICTFGIVEIDRLIIVPIDYDAARSVHMMPAQTAPLDRSVVFGPPKGVPDEWSQLMKQEHWQYFRSDGADPSRRSRADSIAAITALLKVARQRLFRDEHVIPISNIFDALLLTCSSVRELENARSF